MFRRLLLLLALSFVVGVGSSFLASAQEAQQRFCGVDFVTHARFCTTTRLACLKRTGHKTQVAQQSAPSFVCKATTQWYEPKVDPQPTVPKQRTVPKLPKWDLRHSMSKREIKATGVGQLTEGQVQSLGDWILDFIVKMESGREGTVKSVKGDNFVIQMGPRKRNIFKAKTYCSSISVGDEVVFFHSARVCVSNLFVTEDGDTCEVWCP